MSRKPGDGPWRIIEDAPGTGDLVGFLKARLDEDADAARRCGGEEGGVWFPQGHTVDFCQTELSAFHPAIALHGALHDPARALREVEAELRVLDRHALSPVIGDPELPWAHRDDCQLDGDSGHAMTCSTSLRSTSSILRSPAILR
ncbi:DUF6221 family protein [Streptomyces albipurpureus]|uniref:DUF6221 family protein n=1 Tax=Streptomyces albipurpureus TaxID=2897419 RepID=A0ABT0UFY0_9ACTN|nr:DUF6221 family protein [Streptomyces sp. CWNU-1]MCM2387318.1 DUF6221 family protein [Streptomyces sp. CWNU-1]